MYYDDTPAGDPPTETAPLGGGDLGPAPTPYDNPND
jgi:hypothetical protein